MNNKYIVVLIETIQKVGDFVKITSRTESDVTVKSGQYVVNGKSILGVLSLDLSTPVEVVCEDGFSENVWEELLKFRA